jgi:seryl-tRNA(Sec) selenium transferase
MGTEYGVVTNGCAAALAHITAGCLAGTDKALQARLPFTDGMPNEVIVQKCHRFGYDFAIKASGGKLVEVETLEEMQAAISDNTVMMLFLGDALDNHPGQTQVPIATMTALANGDHPAHSTPCAVATESCDPRLGFVVPARLCQHAAFGD